MFWMLGIPRSQNPIIDFYLEEDKKIYIRDVKIPVSWLWQGGHWMSMSSDLQHQYSHPRLLMISLMKQNIFGPNSSGSSEICVCLLKKNKHEKAMVTAVIT